jgi:hydrogenase maturation protein HypF
VPPDLFCCADCLAEMRSPGDRRYRYPFTNCTQCGPRYTIISDLPYDRPKTSMAGFPMCAACSAEYGNPADRRFHAQPLACPDCGPSLVFSARGRSVSGNEAALRATIDCLRGGGIAAVKGIGGYHLICDAANHDAVVRMRARKGRPDKPLAVMFPEQGVDGLDVVRAHVRLVPAEAAACRDPVRPIVLARRRPESSLSAALAPGLSDLGVFLPYSPLHHLLLGDFGGPLVATSGNVSGEPVIVENAEAERRLSGVADGFLHHDRPILRPADDTVLRVISGVARPVRAGRGLAPIEVALPTPLSEPVIAVGGHMKAAVALGWGRRVVVSPHISDLDAPRAREVFARTIADLQALHHVRANRILCDRHPGYASSRWARRTGLPVSEIGHHVTHASARAGEYPEVSTWLVFAWDGTGLGDDGTIWGGEAFCGTAGAWRRVASLRRFHLLGGDRAAREPWRSAAALMWGAGRPWLPPVDDVGLARQAWERRIGTIAASSAGRLFDAAASLIAGVHTVSYEGQGPMLMESMAEGSGEFVELPLERDEDGLLLMDWAPLLARTAEAALPAPHRADIVHESLARAVASTAEALRGATGFEVVGLTGGVFQNRRLSERVTALLAERGIRVLQPWALPANDGGLAFGQVVEFAHAARAGGVGAADAVR